jgi:hypothetical protein
VDCVKRKKKTKKQIQFNFILLSLFYFLFFILFFAFCFLQSKKTTHRQLWDNALFDVGIVFSFFFSSSVFLDTKDNMSSHFAIKTLSRSIDHQPMHHLFSPTALDYDLTYVDKTYYPSSNNSQSNDTATAATTTTTTTTTTTLHNNINTLNKLPDKLSSLQNLALHKTLRLVSSISRLDL